MKKLTLRLHPRRSKGKASPTRSSDLLSIENKRRVLLHRLPVKCGRERGESAFFLRKLSFNVPPVGRRKHNVVDDVVHEFGYHLFFGCDCTRILFRRYPEIALAREKENAEIIVSFDVLSEGLVDAGDG